MHIGYIKRGFVAAIVSFSIVLGGCAGNGDKEESSSEEITETSSFVMPSESVQEATSETAGTTEESETVEVVEVPMETETESESEVDVAANPSETEEPAQAEHIVVLDPGHGGVWYGAMDGNYKEKNLALTVAFYCRDYLLEHYDGVTVYLTRETDVEFSLDQGDDLEERVRIAAEYGAEILVSLHFNTDTTDLAHGALVCVSKQPEVSAESAALGTSILNQLEELGIYNKGLVYKDSTEYFDENGVALDYYAICRYSAAVGIPGIIVEHCFMRNAIDVQYYNSEEALKSLGEADAIGIAQYLGLTEK